jgi:hypothetical protein
MRAVERRSRACRDVERADDFPRPGVERVQLLAGREPDALAVEADAVHAGDVGKGSVFVEDLGGCVFHVLILPGSELRRE